MDAAWLTAFVALATAATTGLAWAVRYGWRLTRRTMQFLDDYFGEAAHDGVETRPGVMARLRSVETLCARVLAETTPNGGGSLRDVISRTAADVAGIRQEQEQMRTRIELFETQRAGRERKS